MDQQKLNEAQSAFEHAHAEDAKAEAAFKRSLELSKFNVSAEFGLARAYQRLGRADDAKLHFARFQRLTQSKIGVPISPIYGEQGPLSLVQRMEGEAQVGAAIPVKFVAVKGSGLPRSGASVARSTNDGGGVCVFDFRGEGKPDMLLANTPGGKGPVPLRNDGGKFSDATAAAGLKGLPPQLGCAVGDYDNDGKPDLALSSAAGVKLLQNEGGGRV